MTLTWSRRGLMHSNKSIISVQSSNKTKEKQNETRLHVGRWKDAVQTVIAKPHWEAKLVWQS